MSHVRSRHESGEIKSASSPVHGLSEEQQLQSIEQFFAHFPWRPSAHTVLAQWDSSRFFETFVR